MSALTHPCCLHVWVAFACGCLLRFQTAQKKETSNLYLLRYAWGPFVIPCWWWGLLGTGLTWDEGKSDGSNGNAGFMLSCPAPVLSFLFRTLQGGQREREDCVCSASLARVPLRIIFRLGKIHMDHLGLGQPPGHIAPAPWHAAGRRVLRVMFPSPATYRHQGPQKHSLREFALASGGSRSLPLPNC